MTVAELIELLSRCPQNSIILAEISGEEEHGDITDVFTCNGTLRGFSYIKVEKYEE